MGTAVSTNVASTATPTAAGASHQLLPAEHEPSCRLPLGAGHQQAQRLAGGIGRGDLAHQPAAGEDDDPVGDADQLVEVLRHQEHAAAGLAQRAQLSVDVLAGADVQTAVGCEATSTVGSRSMARASRTFCMLPPDSDRIGSAGAARMSKRSISDSACAGRGGG